MRREAVYREQLSSRRTSLLFLFLALVFLLLGLWRRAAAGPDALAATVYFLSVFFLFYVINYRKLEIRIDEQAVRLKFGLIGWEERVENIAGCGVDVLTWLQRNGGAGVHLMVVGGRYRISFNFLEHGRVVLRLKRKRGPVRDVSFSTMKAGEVVEIVDRLRSG